MTKHPHTQIRWEHALPTTHAVPTEMPHLVEGHSWMKAAVVAGVVLLGFLALAYLVLPDELPVWIQRSLGLVNAVLAATVFVLATHRSHHLQIGPITLRAKKGQHPDFGKHRQEAHKHSHPQRTVNLPIIGETSVRAISGTGIFVGVLLWWLTPWAPITVQAQEMQNLAAPLGAEIETVVLMLSDMQLAVPHPPVRPAVAASLAARIPIDSDPYLLGQKATAEGRYDDARSLLVAALSSSTGVPADIHLAMAQNELYAGKYLEAAQQYDEVLATHPTSPRLWSQAAAAWLHAGNYARAEELATTAVDMAGRHTELTQSLRWSEQMICQHVQAAVLICRGKDFQKAEDSNKQVQDVWKDLYKDQYGEESAYAASLNNQAVLFQMLGKYPGSQNNQSFAYNTWTKSLGTRHPYLMASRSNLAMLYYAYGRYVEARGRIDQVTRIRSEILPPIHPAQAAGLNVAALIDLDSGDYRKGLLKANRALEILEEDFSPQHPQVAAVVRSLGGFYQGLARYRRAEYYYVRMAEINQAILGDTHPYLAASLRHLASLYLAEARYSEARTQGEFALKIDERAFGQEHPAVARDLCVLGQVLARTNQVEKARPLLERALKIQQATLLEEHPDVAATRAALAALETDPANYDRAIALYEQAINTDQLRLGSRNPMIAQFLYEMARLYLAQGKYDKAEEAANRCLEIRKAALMSYDPRLAEALELQADVFRKTEPDAQAKIDQLIKKASDIRNEHADVNAADSQAMENTGA